MCKIFGWMDQGHHSWYPATLLLKVRVGPSDFSVSPSHFGLDFGTLDFGLELDNNNDDDVL